MSTILKGLLQPQIQTVLAAAGTEIYAGPYDGSTAQQIFAEKLATAIAAAVQQYLVTNVTVNPGILVVTAGSPTNQAGSTTTPGILNAP